MDSKTEPASEAKERNPHEEAIKTLSYKCLQWDNGEIKGYDSQMMDSILPIIMRPLYDRLEQLKSEAQEEITRLKAELEKKHNDLLDALDLKEGNGPTALSMLKAELEREREKSSFLQQRIDGLLKNGVPF